MKLKLIDLYVLKLFLSYFFTALIFVLGGIVIFDGIDTLLGDSSLQDAVYKALQTVPPTLELIVSYVGLLAGLLTFSALYKNGEIISMKIAGLSQFQIIRSIFVAGIAIVFFFILQSKLPRPVSER